MAKTLNNVALAVLATALAGCDVNPKTLATARENGVVVVYHGLFSNDLVTGSGEIAKDLGMVAVEGNSPNAIKLIEAAQNSKNGANLLYHSMGCEGAAELAEKCDKNGLEFRGAYSLDAFKSREFPRNVGVIRNYFSTAPYQFKETSRGGVDSYSETIPNSDHMNLPRKARDRIEDSIKQSRKDKSTNK